jgi:hypothetical protein
MTDAKKRKKMRKHLVTFTRAQLVALGCQRTDLTFQSLLDLDKEELVNTLAGVPDVLSPVQA